MLVFTNGCFDIIHYGHVQLFKHCRNLAGSDGKVVVALNDDDSLRRLKGPDRPIFSLEKRIEVISALRYVDSVISFSEDTPINVIRSLMPDIIVKGGDYRPEDVVGHGITRVEIVKYVDGCSTTKIIESIGHR